MSSLNELKVDVKRGRPSKPLALTLEEGGDVDVLVALSESVGRPVSVLVDPRECLKADKAAARECLKAEKAAEKAAARLALKAAKSAALEAARALAKKEKADAREALKAEKAAARLALKAEKSAALEAARALAKKEKADAREVLKAEKAAAKALEKAEKGKAKKPAAQLVAALARADEPVPELQVEGYEEEEEVCVRVFEHDGKRWLRDDGGAIYDPESHDEVGRWDEESQSVVAMKMPTEPRMMCDNA